jgi:hypothetical protein
MPLSSVTISDSAAELILKKLKEPATIAMRKQNSVATLTWARRVYSTDRLSGERTEHGPHFFFSWSDVDKLKEFNSVIYTLPDGESLALGPSEFFQTGTHTIDVKDGRLALVDAP